MENQNQNNTNQNQHLSPAPTRKPRFWKFALWFVGIIVVVLAAASLASYLSPSARSERELQRNYQKYQQAMSDFEEAMRADTYGGKTPQETLDLFVDALKKGDVELASKYFALETDTKSPDYLTRRKWENGLRKAREEGKLEEIISQLKKAVPAGSSMEGYFGFEVRDGAGKLLGDIGMHFNKYSQVWKIGSL